MSFTLPELPYAKDALAPLMSQETLEYHYAKHHATYVAKLNDLVENTPYADMSLETIITDASNQARTSLRDPFTTSRRRVSSKRSRVTLQSTQSVYAQSSEWIPREKIGCPRFS